MPKFLKKRDLVIFYVISKKYHRELVDIDTISRVLQSTFGYSKKTSYNILKRLAKLGLIKKIKKNGEEKVSVVSIEDYLDDLFTDYLASRIKRSSRNYI